MCARVRETVNECACVCVLALCLFIFVRILEIASAGVVAICTEYHFLAVNLDFKVFRSFDN